MDGAATLLLLEWVEKLFNEKIPSLKDLALFLIDKMYVDNRSVAAITLLSSAAGKVISWHYKRKLEKSCINFTRRIEEHPSKG